MPPVVETVTNSTPGHVPSQLQLALEGLETAWENTGGERKELGKWLGRVKAFMSKKGSSWSPADVQAIADELAEYSLAIEQGDDPEGFDSRKGQTQQT
ncbi:uncharacterized protein RHOBADRAFT_44908 [Rhodotorula graminis WP1]|uniref:Uncharacterized protein n=1 Tax=Rhodotorula graminis (strain WP1) TaxID=578459 RepID=A0A194S112_RHOGW|nr:uncharacterized protein RHOBADRAFT_44908 [Rhodotorula graminis WP1]KPV74418.1 hypothetical protein RHOBADRAFT_44908 [Rhodotorula graminis WP1]